MEWIIDLGEGNVLLVRRVRSPTVREGNYRNDSTSTLAPVALAYARASDTAAVDPEKLGVAF